MLMFPVLLWRLALRRWIEGSGGGDDRTGPWTCTNLARPVAADPGRAECGSSGHFVEGSARRRQAEIARRHLPGRGYLDARVERARPSARLDRFAGPGP